MKYVAIVLASVAIAGYCGYVAGKLDRISSQLEPVPKPALAAPASAPAASQPNASVCVDFTRSKTVDLSAGALDESTLSRIRDEDKQNVGGVLKNRLSVFQTSKGFFRVVLCFGRQSIDPNSASDGKGVMYATLQLPSGKWTADTLDIVGVSTSADDGYLICRFGVYQLVGADKLIRIVSFADNGSRGAPMIRRGSPWANRYWEVSKSDSSGFGGFLECANGVWLFRRYNGIRKGWVDKFLPDGDKRVIFLSEGLHPIEFYPEIGEFTDL